MQRIELQHNTPDQVRDYLKTALRIMDETLVDEATYRVLAPTVLNLVASKQVVLQQPQQVNLPAGLINGMRA